MVTAVVVLTKAFVSGFLSSTLEYKTSQMIYSKTQIGRKFAKFILGCNYLPKSGANSHKFDIMNFIGSPN